GGPGPGGEVVAVIGVEEEGEVFARLGLGFRVPAMGQRGEVDVGLPAERGVERIVEYLVAEIFRQASVGDEGKEGGGGFVGGEIEQMAEGLAAFGLRARGVEGDPGESGQDGL